MDLAWGVIMIIFALLEWLGQAASAFWPTLATRLGLLETESDVDQVFYVDARAEAIWDTLTGWTLLVAGVLLVLDNAAWAYFGLIGGSIYLYFAGRGILVPPGNAAPWSPHWEFRVREIGLCTPFSLGHRSCGHNRHGSDGVALAIANRCPRN